MSRVALASVVVGGATLCSFLACSSPVDEGSGNQAGATNTSSSGAGGTPSAAGSSGLGGAASGSAGAHTAGASAAGASASGGSTAVGGAGGGTSAGAGSGGSAGGSSGGSAGAAGSGGSGAGTNQSAGCGKPPGMARDVYDNGKNVAITAANLQRRYVLSVPSNYDNTKAYKLIIAWHQRDGNDNQMYKNDFYHLKPLANDTAIFVAPNGQLGGKPCAGTGNGEASCGWPNTNDTDIALADAVVKQIEDNFCVDKSRIFATGWSYGGSMSYATACQRPLGAPNGFTRAIAVYSGAQLSGGCKPSMPVAYYASHGTHDSVLKYDLGVTLAQNFAQANGCNWMTPTSVTSGDHVCTTLTGCKSGYPEQFCSFNGDHTPDPRDPNQPQSWEYANVWKFFSQF
jgi:poly(3-hydroxybutyrate) depolymerase